MSRTQAAFFAATSLTLTVVPLDPPPFPPIFLNASRRDDVSAPLPKISARTSSVCGHGQYALLVASGGVLMSPCVTWAS